MARGLRVLYLQKISILSLAVTILLLSSAVIARPSEISDDLPATYVKDADILTIEQAVAEASSSNPALAAIVARAEGLGYVTAQANALPDPKFMLNAMNLPLDSFSLKQEAMTQIQIGVSQQLPFPGKLALRSEVAELLAGSAHYEADEMRLRLVRDVKLLWWNIFYLDRALDITQRNQSLLRQFVEIAQTKYKVGQGLQQDVLLAQLELSKLLDQFIQLTESRSVQVIRLNTLLNRPSQALIRLPASTAEVLPKLIEEKDLQHMALKNHPRLMAAGDYVKAAQVRKSLAEADYKPDFALTALYGRRDGVNPDASDRADFASFMLNMNLPLWTKNRQDKVADQRNSEWQQMRYKFADAENSISEDVSRFIAGYQRAAEQVKLYRTGIIPQARQTVSSMMSGYQVNKVDFLNLVRAQVTLFNYEKQYWLSISQANQKLSQLVAAVSQEVIYE